MQILLSEQFQKDVRALQKNELAAVFQSLLSVEKQFRHPHSHSGIGVRKLHASGIFEARAGLHFRLIFATADDMIIFHRAGNHDDIHRYLRSL